MLRLLRSMPQSQTRHRKATVLLFAMLTVAACYSVDACRVHINIHYSGGPDGAMSEAKTKSLLIPFSAHYRSLGELRHAIEKRLDRKKNPELHALAVTSFFWRKNSRYHMVKAAAKRKRIRSIAALKKVCNKNAAEKSDVLYVIAQTAALCKAALSPTHAVATMQSERLDKKIFFREYVSKSTPSTCLRRAGPF